MFYMHVLVISQSNFRAFYAQVHAACLWPHQDPVPRSLSPEQDLGSVRVPVLNRLEGKGGRAGKRQGKTNEMKGEGRDQGHFGNSQGRSQRARLSEN